MLSQLTQLAVVESANHAEESQDILTGLGIDGTLLVLQAIAFLLMVFVLAKWVYPVFMRIIDEREAKIEESTKAADEAKKAAEDAESKVEAELKKARKEAAEIVAIAKTEVAQMHDRSDKKAKERAEHIVSEAHKEIEKSILAAQKKLEKDTIDFVKQAASLVTAGVADDKLDTELVKKSVHSVSAAGVKK